MRLGQALPPYLLYRVTIRPRCCIPPPHDLEHLFHGFHIDTSQSIGQTLVLHGHVRFSFGHSFPPCIGAVVTCRLLMIKPPPQVCVQPDALPQLDTAQSTGQLKFPHGRCCKVGGHDFPPNAAGMLTTLPRS